MLRTIERNSVASAASGRGPPGRPGGGRGLRIAFTELDLARLADEAVDAMQTSARGPRCRHSPWAQRAGAGLRRPDPPPPAVRQPAVQCHQVLAARRAGARGAWTSLDALRPASRSSTRGPASPRRTGPALRALLPSGLVGRAGVPGPASDWPSPSRWPRPTRGSSTSSTRPAGRPPSGSSCRCIRRRTPERPAAALTAAGRGAAQSDRSEHNSAVSHLAARAASNSRRPAGVRPAEVRPGPGGGHPAPGRALDQAAAGAR